MSEPSNIAESPARDEERANQLLDVLRELALELHPGHEVRVVDPAGRELGEREQSGIQFRGASATRGHHRPAADSTARRGVARGVLAAAGRAVAAADDDTNPIHEPTRLETG